MSALVSTQAETPGLLKGVFSVSPTRKVRFSQGNLQYMSTGTHMTADGVEKAGTWQFAAHQYTIRQRTNDFTNYTLIDMFAWGTSGGGANAKNPNVSYSTGPTGSYASGGLVGQNAYYDPGVYNAISNGGNAPSLWRMLTKDEIIYLLFERPNAYKLRGKGAIKVACPAASTTRGMFLLPDDWEQPASITFYSGDVYDVPDANIFTLAQWEEMEAHGAVFLPGTGTVPQSFQDYNWGEYDLATSADNNDGFTKLTESNYLTTSDILARKYSLDFYCSLASSTRVTCKADMKRSRRHCLRLVQDVDDDIVVLTHEIQNYTPPAPISSELRSVDLGLSVRWANINLGATSIEKQGDYYQWASTEVFSSTDECAYYNSTDRVYTKYNDNDHLHLLQSTDDVIQQKWGGAWRTPSVDEWNELASKCAWYPLAINGRVAMKLIGPNGNYIYLPMTGASNNPNSKCISLWTNSLNLARAPKNSNDSVFNSILGAIFYQDPSPISTPIKIAYNTSGYRSRNIGRAIRGVTTEVVDGTDVMPEVVMHTITIHIGSRTEEIHVPHGANLALYAYSLDPGCQHVTGWTDGVKTLGRTLTNVTADQTLTVSLSTSDILVTAEPDSPSHGSCSLETIP